MSGRVISVIMLVAFLISVPTAFADPNLVGWWTFDEGSGSTASDSSINGNDGTVYEANWTTGQIKYALDFDGSNDYVSAPDDNSLDIPGAITVSAWVKPDVYSIHRYVVGKNSSGQYTTGAFFLKFDNTALFTDETFRLVFGKADGTYPTGGGNYGTDVKWDRVVSEKNDWETGVWYHVAAMWNGTTNPNSMKMYVDGVLNANHTANQSTIKTNDKELHIGQYSGGPFNGKIDDVRVYNRALSAGEIQDLYIADDEGELHVPLIYPTIQAAIDNSNNGDHVIVEPNVYTGVGNCDLDFLGKAITVRSANPYHPNVVETTIIDCNGSPNEPHRGFYFHNNENANSVLTGFTITNGHVDWGGGIRCDNSSPTITNCVISGNEASSWGGGGIFCSESSPIMTNCSLSNNSTVNGEGGGMLIAYDSSPIVTDCTFTGNEAYFGGAIMCDFNNSPLVTNCIIADNSAVSGAGMYNSYYGTPIVKNCLFYGNSTPNNGGGMYSADNSNAIITGCTFSKNSAGWGGGMVVYDSDPTITNCIFWDNTPSQQIYVYAGSPTVSYSDVQGGWPGTGNINSDPCFVDADTNDFHLLPYSPCINTGDPNYIPEPNETDIDGYERVTHGRIDMGADELPLDCIAETNPAYDYWVGGGIYPWSKPDCWCYERQCRGDGDGLMQGPFPVASLDLDLFRSAFGVHVSQFDNTLICADYGHSMAGPFPVGSPDLNIFRTYFNKHASQVPPCGNPPDPNYNFWITP